MKDANDAYAGLVRGVMRDLLSRKRKGSCHKMVMMVMVVMRVGLNKGQSLRKKRISCSDVLMAGVMTCDRSAGVRYSVLQMVYALGKAQYVSSAGFFVQDVAIKFCAQDSMCQNDYHFVSGWCESLSLTLDDESRLERCQIEYQGKMPCRVS